MEKSTIEPIRIGVISDTHLRDSAAGYAFFQDLVTSVLAPVDMILHAGDLIAPELLEAFADCPIHAVRGNMDPSSRDIPIKKVIKAAGYRIGLIHGWGAAAGIEQRVREEFPRGSLDCLIYGHTHRPACHYHDGVLMFNPGSATDRRRAPFHSVGLLELGEAITGTIICLD